MASFSKRSKDRLATCHPDLQLIMNIAIRFEDFTVLCGHRGEHDQNAAYAAGNSRAKYGDSRHNHVPSQAVDIAPYPIDWEDTARFAKLAGRILQIADELNIDLEWGGDWESLKDMPHFEKAGE